MKKERKTARQILSGNPREVISVGPADAVLTALRLMADKDVTTVLVLQSSNLVGILSQRDYARKVELAGRSAAETRVGQIMTTQVFYVTPEHTCDQCLALMHTRRIRHLPVIDSGRVIGVLSNSDVLEELIQEDEHFIRILEHDMLYLTIDTGGRLLSIRAKACAWRTVQSTVHDPGPPRRPTTDHSGQGGPHLGAGSLGTSAINDPRRSIESEQDGA